MLLSVLITSFISQNHHKLLQSWSIIGLCTIVMFLWYKQITLRCYHFICGYLPDIEVDFNLQVKLNWEWKQLCCIFVFYRLFIYVLPLEIQCVYMYCHWRSSVYICVAIGDPVCIYVLPLEIQCVYVLPLEIQCLYMYCHWRSSVYICVAIGDPVFIYVLPLEIQLSRGEGWDLVQGIPLIFK